MERVLVVSGSERGREFLRELLRGIMPRYLGMIGSKRRTVGLLNMLEEEGFSRADLDRIHTPIGLDIGALTVKEIAQAAGVNPSTVSRTLRRAKTRLRRALQYAL